MQPDFRIPINRNYQEIDLYVSEYMMEIGRESMRVRTRAPLPPGTRVQFVYALCLDQLHFVSGTALVGASIPEQAGRSMMLNAVQWDAESARLVDRIVRGAL